MTRKGIKGLKIDLTQTAVFELILPYPPSVNQLYGVDPKTKRRYLTQKGKDFKRLAWYRIMTQKRAAGLEKGIIFDAVQRVDLNFFPPDFRKRDVDNLIKITLDVCTENEIWKDDRLVKKLCVDMGETDKESPRTTIKITGIFNKKFI
jgi:crossover junction endodeoxyribonuclease RusA